MQKKILWGADIFRGGETKGPAAGRVRDRRRYRVRRIARPDCGRGTPKSSGWCREIAGRNEVRNGGRMGAISYICLPCQFDFPGRIALYLTGFYRKNHKIINT